MVIIGNSWASWNQSAALKNSKLTLTDHSDWSKNSPLVLKLIETDFNCGIIEETHFLVLFKPIVNGNTWEEMDLETTSSFFFRLCYNVFLIDKQKWRNSSKANWILSISICSLSESFELKTRILSWTLQSSSPARQTSLKRDVQPIKLCYNHRKSNLF